MVGFRSSFEIDLIIFIIYLYKLIILKKTTYSVQFDSIFFKFKLN